MSIEFNLVPSSQIMPVSSAAPSTQLTTLKNDAEEFFFKRSRLCYKSFKNAYANAFGSNKNKIDFINNYLRILEETILASQAESETAQEKRLIIKGTFEIMRQSIGVLVNSNVDLDIEQFYAATAGFLIGKLK